MVLQVCAELHDDGSVLSDEDIESWKENVSCTPSYKKIACTMCLCMGVSNGLIFMTYCYKCFSSFPAVACLVACLGRDRRQPEMRLHSQTTGAAGAAAAAAAVAVEAMVSSSLGMLLIHVNRT